MVTVYDVEAGKLVRAAAKKLEGMNISAPPWVGMVKSGAHCQRLPQDEKFWHIRCASLLRQAYIHSPIGVSSLRTHYGGRKARGVKPEEYRKRKLAGASRQRAMHFWMALQKKLAGKRRNFYGF